MIDSPNAFTANAAPGAAMVIQVDSDAGARMLAQLLSTMRWNQFWSAAAFIGLIAACFFIYATINHVAVLQYDLMDLRAQTGFAHQNTPNLETDDSSTE